MIVGSLLLILVAVALLVLGLAVGSSGLLVGSIVASLLAAVALIVGARQDAGEGPDDGYGDGELDEQSAAAGRRDVADVAESRYAMAGTRTAGRTDQWSTPYAERSAPTEPLSGGAPPQAPPRGGGLGGPSRGDAGVYGQRRFPDWSEGDGGSDTVAGARLDTGPPPAGGAAGAAGAAGGQDFDDEDPPDEPAPQVVPPAAAARVARMTTDVLVIDGRPRYHLPGCVHLLGRDSEPLPVGEAVELGFTPCSLCEPDTALLADPRQG